MGCCGLATASRRPLTPALKPVQDSDERACAYIAGPAPSRWGAFSPDVAVAPPGAVPPPAQVGAFGSREELEAARAARRSHPLFASVCLSLLTEVINSRLFTTVSWCPSSAG